ncbi:dihydrofolate synthetase [[Candida] railenensis]|uniref:Dihydrofolate synthetase n=1 Tax=[Candida] railenensis TaxID=45579 RepID=A0A9P0QQQ6_9ASCO|nr:dihydrofolate synthetase [[Candida] railenensis]
MPIDLGLTRVSTLLKRLGNPHLAYNTIHIAGTNGKGSTIAYLSSIFTKAGIKNGRFTSPHMLYYNDCISMDENIYPLSKFEEISTLVKQVNVSFELGCTEFELLTATAYKIFEVEKISLAIIEVGLGGRLDATNVLEPPTLLATGITKIAFDHENLLGNTLKEIAFEKAGIIKSRVPVVVDGSNNKEVIDVVESRANALDSPLTLVDPAVSGAVTELIEFSPLKGAYQVQNLGIALKIVDIICSHSTYQLCVTPDSIKEGIKATKWPGRLQSVDVPLSTGSTVEILLDGAHNESAAIELGKYLDSKPNRSENGLVYIIAMTKGKNIDSLLKYLLSKDDTVILTGFSTPENMPWIQSSALGDLEAIARKYTENVYHGNEGSIEKVISQAQRLSEKRGSEIVVCGSLYLCSDVLRYVDSYHK